MLIKVRDAHKMLIANGWEMTHGGKGSHRKYKKGGRMYILPYHGGGKDISPKVEKSLQKLFKK